MCPYCQWWAGHAPRCPACVEVGPRDRAPSIVDPPKDVCDSYAVLAHAMTEERAEG